MSTDDDRLSEREQLARVIRAITDLWDEPLDEVHDVPPIVNAILAAGWVPPEAVREAERERDDLSERLSELLCDLTDGLLSKPTYTVRAMVQQVEETFDKCAQADVREAERRGAVTGWDEGAEAAYEWAIGVGEGKPANPYADRLDQDGGA